MFLTLLILASAAEPSPTPPPKPPLICRQGEREVGSHIRTGRTCLTAEEWARKDADRENKPANMRITEGQSTPTGLPGSPH
jgi:hypothetical protein